MVYIYEDDCLESDYLITSQETCFSLEYLWELTVEIICYKASFTAMTKKFEYMNCATQAKTLT